MKILLTGGAGFIGSNILRKLITLENVSQIVTIDNLNTGNISNIPLSNKIKFVKMDCSDDNILNIDEIFDCIIHIAGQASKEASFNDVFYDLNANTKSTLNLLELCRKINCKRFIFMSSVCVYGGTTNPGVYNENSEINYDTFYSIHKYVSEKYLLLYKKHYNIDYTIFRLFTCYGPGQDLNANKGMIGIYLNQFLNDSPDIIIKGSLDRYRDFIYIDDVVRIVTDSIDNNLFYNNILNLGSSKKTTIRELLDIFIKIGSYKKNIIVENELIGDMLGCVSDNSKLLSIYNNDYNFIPLENGIHKMIEYYTNGNRPTIIKIDSELDKISDCISQIKYQYGDNMAFMSYVDGEYGCRVWYYNSSGYEFSKIQKENNKIVVGLVFKGNTCFIRDLCDIIIELQTTDFNCLINIGGPKYNILSNFNGDDNMLNSRHAYSTYLDEYETIIDEFNFNDIFFTAYCYGFPNIYKFSGNYNGLINNIKTNLNYGPKYINKNNIRLNKKKCKNDNIAIWIRNTKKHTTRNMSPEIYNTVFNYCIENKKHLYVFLDLIPAEVPINEYIHIVNIRENNVPLFDKFLDVCNICYIYIGGDSGSSEIINAYTNTNIILTKYPDHPDYYTFNDRCVVASTANDIINQLNKYYE